MRHYAISDTQKEGCNGRMSSSRGIPQVAELGHVIISPDGQGKHSLHFSLQYNRLQVFFTLTNEMQASK